MHKRLFFLAVLIFICAYGFAQSSKITAKELQNIVEFLASDSLKGRKTGTAENNIAAAYILKQFTNNKLRPLADNGFQYFEILADVVLGSKNKLVINDFEGILKNDFVPLAFSSSGELTAEVIFGGYGFDIDLDSIKWNDYEGLDIKGKWVMILRDDPELDNSESKFIPFSNIRNKLLMAKDNGVAGVLLVTPKGSDKEDKLMPMVVESNEITSGIPVINIKREIADRLLIRTGFTIDSLESILVGKKAPMSLNTGVTLSGSVDLIRRNEKTANIIALLESRDPVYKDEYLIVGAHYDHLGFGGPGSGSRTPDTNAIHNGADDNASGTALIIELSKRLAAEKKHLKRSIIFVAFSGEEIGLLGSKYFVNHPPVEITKMKAMFNFDMVGRFDKEKQSISISGTGTSLEAEPILSMQEAELPFKVVHSSDGYGPSDHAAFYASNIPVFYFSTGAHTDYHTPFDDTKKLDFATEKIIGDFAAKVILAIDSMDQPLTFKESGKKSVGGRSGRKLRVTLGILPDFAGAEKKGLRVDGVTKDGPADRGGIKKSDIITEINGMSVGNIYDYMSRLSKLKQGTIISVEVIRDGKNEILLIQL